MQIRRDNYLLSDYSVVVVEYGE